MRKLLLTLLLLSPIATWGADCFSPGNLTIGGSVVCVQANSKTGTTTNVSGDAISFTTIGTGHQIVMWGYICTTNNCTTPSNWVASHVYPTYTGSGQETTGKILPTTNNPCGFTFASTTGGTSSSSGSQPTWSSTPCTSTATITDGTVTWTPVVLQTPSFNGPSTSCISASPTSPQALQLAKSYLNWSWYCPSAPASVGTYGLNCTVTAACSFISMFIQEYTGMCSTAPCYESDGAGSGAAETSQSASVSPSTIYTNDLITYLAGSINDEALTAGGGCVQIDQHSGITGNQVGAKYATSAGAQSCSVTWTGSDTGGMLIVAIKSAASVLTIVPNQFPRIMGAIRP